MESDIAAREFLQEYLPPKVLEIVDLSHITLEKESYVENDLKRQLSDVVLSLKTKKGDNAFAYILAEHQSTPDKWLSMRLWKYMLSLCERHKKTKGKLPLIIPIVLYNGTKKYNSARTLWELFVEPELAQELMCNPYKLINLQEMSDDQLMTNLHLGIFEFFMKHIHKMDMLELWERFLTEFNSSVLIDRENGYVYIKKLLWYT